MIPSLVEPLPRTLTGLRAWEWLWERLETQSPRALKALLEVVKQEVIDGIHPWTLGIRKQFVGAQGKRIAELLKGALMVGTIRAFAADPIEGKAFAVKMGTSRTSLL